MCFYNISTESYITTCNNAEKDGLSAVDSFILSNDWKSLPKSITDRNNVQHVKLTETVWGKKMHMGFVALMYVLKQWGDDYSDAGCLLYIKTLDHFLVLSWTDIIRHGDL